MNRALPQTGSVNLTSQRISFVNKIGIILKATADDESPTPGYLYREINDISFESVGYSESLVEYLVDRLRHNSCNVKFKVLKVIKYLVENGSREFILGVHKHSAALQECTKFNGPPHPMHGNSPYLLVRKIATEVCVSLYSMTQQDSTRPTEAKFGEGASAQLSKSMQGFGNTSFNQTSGPAKATGSIQGFGNTPANQSKGLGEVFLGGLEKLSAKLSETPSDRQAALLANLDFSGAASRYQPPQIPTYVAAESADVTTNASNAPSLSPVVRQPAKKYTPGKAGGGWGDDDDDDGESEDDDNDNEDDKERRTKQSSIDTDSLGGQDAKLSQVDESQTDSSQENELLTKTLEAGSTGPGKQLLAPSQVSSFVEEASRVNCVKLVEMLTQRLTQPNYGAVMRALQLLEGLIFNQGDLISADTIASTCSKNLVTCYTNSQTSKQNTKLFPNKMGKPREATTTDLEHQKSATDENITGHSDENVDTDEIDPTLEALRKSVCIKTAKLILILQQLSSKYKEILSNEHFSMFLSKSNNNRQEAAVS